MTLPELTLAFAARRELRSTSIAQYNAAVGCLARFLGRIPNGRDLSDETINRWLISLEGRLASATRRSRRNHLLALWRAGVRLGAVSKPPGEIRRIKAPPSVPRAWDASDVRRIRDEAKNLPGKAVFGLPLSVKVPLIVAMGWDSAARWGDVRTFASGEISNDGILPFVQRKTGRIHVAKFHASTMQALEASGFRSRSWLADWEFTDEYFRIVFRDLLKQLGLPGSFKWIRRSSGTNVEMLYPGAGAAHLGHGPAIAVNHYFDARLIAASRPMPEEL